MQKVGVSWQSALSPRLTNHLARCGTGDHTLGGKATFGWHTHVFRQFSFRMPKPALDQEHSQTTARRKPD